MKAGSARGASERQKKNPEIFRVFTGQAGAEGVGFEPTVGSYPDSGLAIRSELVYWRPPVSLADSDARDSRAHLCMHVYLSPPEDPALQGWG
jgi:hypothetical protein